MTSKMKYILITVILSISLCQKSNAINQQKLLKTEQLANTLPSSILKNQQDDKKHQEIYKLGCPNITHYGTEDMEHCAVIIIKQLEVIQNKYIAEIKNKIEEGYKDNIDLQKETLSSFEKENDAWNALVDAGGEAIFSYYQQGSIRGTIALTRKISLMEFRIHEQWLAWIVEMDGTSTLPEPVFDDISPKQPISVRPWKGK